MTKKPHSNSHKRWGRVFVRYALVSLLFCLLERWLGWYAVPGAWWKTLLKAVAMATLFTAFYILYHRMGHKEEE